MLQNDGLEGVLGVMVVVFVCCLLCMVDSMFLYQD